MTWTSNDVPDENTETLAWEQERKALAELLHARGNSLAAALVTMAEYRCDQVDNLDGGQYEVDLALPADVFDRADADVRTELADAAQAVIGEGHFQGLAISVRRSALTPSWDKDLLDSMRAEPPSPKPLELNASPSLCPKDQDSPSIDNGSLISTNVHSEQGLSLQTTRGEAGMRLSRVKITNHSRIQDLDLKVRRHAVIVGANDVGKSSILRMLNLLLGTSTAGLYQALKPGDLRDPEQPLVVDAWWTGFTEENRRPFPSEISIAEDQVGEYLWVRMVIEPDPEDDEAVSIRRWFPESGHERTPSREQLETFGWRYLKATRGASMMEGAHSPIRTLLAAAELGSNEEALKTLLGQFNDELASNKSVGELLGRVADHLSRSMPNAVDKDDFSVRSVTDPSSDVLQDVTIFLNRGDGQVSLAEQSDGVRQLMSMTLFDLAEGTANVLAIDEPEIHLHPTSQRTAAELLSGEGNQKIIVTHSPYVLHRFEPSEVIAVDRHGKCHQIGESKLSNVEKVRAHWWSPRLLEALTARFVVLVEGDADRVIVESVADNLSIDLDRLGAVILELDGAHKFKNVFPLLGPDGFGPTLLGLVDKNESASWVHAFGGKPHDVVDKKVFISDADLEDEYTCALGGPVAAKALIDGEFCLEKWLLQAAAVDAVEKLSPEAVAKYCRKNGKVEAATCISEVLTPDTAEKIGSVTRLLRVLDELSRQ